MSDLPLNSIDLIVIGTVVLSGLLSLFRGFVKEVLSVGSWVGAALVALYGFGYAQPIAREHIGSELIADLAAVLALFVVALVVFSVLTHILCEMVKDGAVGAVDRSLGFGFGVLRGAVIVSLAVIVLDTLIPDRTEQPGWATEARTRPWLDDGARLLLGMVPRDLREQLPVVSNDLLDGVDQSRESLEQIQRLNDAVDGLRNSSDTKQNAPETEGGYNQGHRDQLNQLSNETQ
ncbi:MAG: CvpA family protein [Alphaproteobacteria bacterium]|nr:CvpA family protein [Alphaproteobacteria bacterium]